MGWKPTTTPLCPWCDRPILAGQDTARMGASKALWHSGCAEDYERADREIDQIQEMTQ